jgi:hypothetical protein
VVRRVTEYLGGLPFSVEFHESIPPHLRSGKIQTIVVQRKPNGAPATLEPSPTATPSLWCENAHSLKMPQRPTSS